MPQMMDIYNYYFSERTPGKIRALIVEGFLTLSILLFSISAHAEGEAWVMSIPYAISNDHIYKVDLRKIDGVNTESATKYRLNPGQHIIGVSLLLVVEWDPTLENGSKSGQDKDFVLDVKTGTTYQIGARLNPEAPVESQLDGSYWTPILYRTYAD